MSEVDDDLAEVYQGKISLGLSAQLRTDFKAWHKPRKHYLRIKQWSKETDGLIRRLKLKSGDELRYLGLPGEDLLDLWVLRNVCERSKIKLRYVGFDSSRRSANLNLASHKINSSDFIHPASIVLGDPLQSILRGDSPGFKYADANAPYDVINLDLCDSVVNQKLPESFPNLEIVRALCDLQNHRPGHPWILFLTTRVVKEGLSGVALKKMFYFVIENIKCGAPFSELFEDKLHISGDKIQSATDAEEFNKQEWLDCHTLAFAKWLLAYLVKKSCSVQILDSYFYNVVAGGKDMVSLGFMIEPINVATDPSGMTVGQSIEHTTSLDEPSLACEMIEKISQMPDVDKVLYDDKAAFDKFAEKKAILLESVGYDPEVYRSWARSESEKLLLAQD